MISRLESLAKSRELATAVSAGYRKPTRRARSSDSPIVCRKLTRRKPRTRRAPKAGA